MSAVENELLAVLGILLIAAGVYFEMPRSAWLRRMPGRADNPPVAPVSYVQLDPAAEGAVMRAAKDSWRSDGGHRLICTDLFFPELPESAQPPVLSPEMRSAPPPLPAVKHQRVPFLPSQRAPDPQQIKLVEGEDSPPFSREELLKID